MKFVALLLIAQSCFGACATTWANGYAKCVEITLDHTKIPNTDQTDFTNLICFNGDTGTNCDAALGTLTLAALKGTGSGGSVTSASCFDCILTSDNAGTTKLSWETEFYVGASGKADFRTKLTRSHTTDDKIYLFLGNAGTTTFQGGALGTAWSSSTTGAFHVSDGTTLSDVNSAKVTSAANHGGTATTGKTDGGIAVVSNTYLNLTDSTEYFTIAGSYSSWVNASSFANAYNSVFGLDENAGNVFTLMVKSNGKLACYVAGTGGTTSYDGTGSTLSTGTWYHLVMTYSAAAGLVGYINGVVDGTGTAKGNLTTVTPFRAIRWGDHASIAGRFWSGSLDEGRLYNIALSADWIVAMYNNESSPSTFYSVAAAVDPVLGGIRHRVIM